MVSSSLFFAFLCLTCTGLAYGQADQVARELSLKNVKVEVVAADGSKILSNSGAYPASLLASPQIPAQQSIEVTASVLASGQEFKPQQVFLAAKHKKSGVAAFAIGKAKKGSAYTISLSPAAIEKQIGKLAGEYEVSLIVGDPSAAKGIHWVLGSVELVLPSGSADVAVKTASVQPLNNIKPVIQHIFRAPEKRPPAIVSLVFAALAFLPLVAVVVVVLFGIKVNFNAWPTDATTSLYALLFHGLILATLGLYLVFWFKWNLAQTLPVALGLGVALMLVGHKALSGLASARLLKKD